MFIAKKFDSYDRCNIENWNVKVLLQHFLYVQVFQSFKNSQYLVHAALILHFYSVNFVLAKLFCDFSIATSLQDQVPLYSYLCWPSASLYHSLAVHRSRMWGKRTNCHWIWVLDIPSQRPDPSGQGRSRRRMGRRSRMMKPLPMLISRRGAEMRAWGPAERLEQCLCHKSPASCSTDCPRLPVWQRRVGLYFAWLEIGLERGNLEWEESRCWRARPRPFGARNPEVFLAIFFVETPETLISPQAACNGPGPPLKLWHIPPLLSGSSPYSVSHL